MAAQSYSRKEFLMGLGALGGVSLVGASCLPNNTIASGEELLLSNDLFAFIAPRKSNLFAKALLKTVAIYYHFHYTYEDLRRRGQSFSASEKERMDLRDYVAERVRVLEKITLERDVPFKTFLARPIAEHTFDNLTGYLKSDASEDTRAYLYQIWGKPVDSDLNLEEAFEHEGLAVTRTLQKNSMPSMRRWFQHLAAFAAMEIPPDDYRGIHEATSRYIASSSIFTSEQKQIGTLFLEGAAPDDASTLPRRALSAYATAFDNRHSGDAAILAGGPDPLHTDLQLKFGAAKYGRFPK